MELYKDIQLEIDWDSDEMDGVINGSRLILSPSNLAIIKYWGKHGNQLPRNPSVSFTLSKALSDTQMNWFYWSPDMEMDAKELGDDDFRRTNFKLNNVTNNKFADKVQAYLDKVEYMFPFLDSLSFNFFSDNTFPQGTGIASSASGMSAIALGLCQLEQDFFQTFKSDEEMYRKASYAARLGSGSACRSIYGGWVEWGKSPIDERFSDYYATPLTEIHPSFMTLKDSILIASKKEKSVSSTAGHALMENNPYAEVRYKQAHDRLGVLLKALKEGDWGTFGEIAESEALILHALMMSSPESYILMHPNTLKMIEVIRDYRKQTGQHVYFSLDAGPNIHMLYPADIEKDVRKLINHKLKKLCEGGTIIHDEVGFGPEIAEQGPDGHKLEK